MSEYTRGPWQMGTHTSDGFCVAPEWDWPTHRGEGRIIANHLLNESDARLIAAAPDLFEALKRVDIWAHRGHYADTSKELGEKYYQIHLSDGPLAVTNVLWEEAETAIRKAEGKYLAAYFVE